MVGTKSTEEMYRGNLDHTETARMPNSATEAYNASRSEELPELGDENGTEYDPELMGDAMEVYETFENNLAYQESNSEEDHVAVEEFEGLWSEN